MSGINRFFFKNQEENAAVVRLYGVEKEPAGAAGRGGCDEEEADGEPGRADGALGRTGVGAERRGEQRFRPEQPIEHARSAQQGRKAPSASFYTGTPVEIVADAGDGWSQVTIGGGVNSLSGYMMTRYLAEDASAVQDMTKEMQVVSPYGTQSVVVRNTPSNSYDAVAMAEVGDEVRVIGTKGDYYYVLLGDGSVGCLSTSEAN